VANRLLAYYCHMIELGVELEQENDGRWMAEVTELPGILPTVKRMEMRVQKALALALRVFADRFEHGEAGTHRQKDRPSL
jgi:hypothetical protein